MQKNITLEISIWGSVFDARVYLEGNEIKLWQTNTSKKIKFRKLPNYDVDGTDLDVVLKTEGKNGSSVTLTIKFDNIIIDTITCINNKGIGNESKSYSINV